MVAGQKGRKYGRKDWSPKHPLELGTLATMPVGEFALHLMDGKEYVKFRHHFFLA